MRNRIIPYLSLGLASALVYLLSRLVADETIKTVLLGVFSNSLFFFLAYLFYDLIQQRIVNKEKRLLLEYIRRRVSNDLFVSLYFMKKIIHGYNLESNTIENILGLINYSETEVFRSIVNQNYLGFQIFRKIDEVRTLLDDTLSNNLILKYTSHTEITKLLQMANNFTRLESALRNRENFRKVAETGVEFKIIHGKSLNLNNDDKILLVKRTSHADRYVVYDSGYFEREDEDLLLERYVLQEKPARQIAALVSETLSLMRNWLPEVTMLRRNEKRFRIIKDFFSPSTDVLTNDVKIHVADIVQSNKEA